MVHTFKPGDCAQLKNTHQKMTVTKVLEDGTLECFYSDGKTEMTKLYNQVLLEECKPSVMDKTDYVS